MLHTRLLIGNLCSAGVMWAHSPILPDPQQIQYVSRDTFRYADYAFVFAHNAADEDQFPAHELAASCQLVA